MKGVHLNWYVFSFDTGSCSIINLGEWGVVTGLITAITSLALLVIRSVVASFTRITKTLSRVSYNSELLTKDLESSKSDRLTIHEGLRRHDKRLDAHVGKLVEHTRQVKAPFRETSR